MYNSSFLDRCEPYFVNIVPLAYEHDAVSLIKKVVYLNLTHSILTPWQATGHLFTEKMRYIVAVYGYMVGTNYLFVFVLLVIIYLKILRWIRILRRQNRSCLTFT